MTRSRDKDGGWAWTVLCACSMCIMVSNGLAILAGMFQTVFLEEFQGGVVFTSWITSLFASLMQLAGPLSGLTSSVFGCRVSVMAGGCLLTLGLLLSAFCRSLTSLLLAFGISGGLGLGLIYSAAVVAVNFSFVKYRPLATGVVLAAGGLGVMGMPALCRFLLDAYSWQETLLILSCVSAQLLVAGAMLFPSDAHTAGTGCRNLWNACLRFTRRRKRSVPGCVPEHTVSLLEHSDTRHRNLERHSDQSAQKSSSLESLSSEREHSTLQSTHTRTEGMHKEMSHQWSSNGGDITQLESKTLTQLDSAEQDDDRDTRDRCVDTSWSKPDFSLSNSGDGNFSDIVDIAETSVCYDGDAIEKTTEHSENEMFVSQPSPDMNPHLQNNSRPQKQTSPRLSAKYLSVVTSPSLCILCLQLFLLYAANGIVLVHFVTFCMERGSSFDDVSVSFSVNGLALTLSRGLVGLLAQDVNVDPLCIYVGLNLLASCIVLLTPVFAVNTASQIAVMGLLGTYCGGSYSLITEITIHCTGVDTLSVAFGLEMISGGLGFLVAPPIAGWLVDLTGSYSNAIFLAGLLEFLATFVALTVAITRPPWSPKPRHGDKELSVDLDLDR